MRPSLLSLLAVPLVALLGLGCSGPLECTLIGCESTIVVDYGVVVNEPYSLTISASGPTVSVNCLDNDPDAEPVPEWLTCDASGFVLTGERAEGATTVTVTVVPLSSGEAVIPNALVPLLVEDTNQPNGPDCEPVCYRRVGSVPPNGGPG